uniref:Uncharacterized protein n=1 Tax=Arundo donax TaxID=35708 RepID=A0A0A9DN78_ARUDO
MSIFFSLNKDHIMLASFFSRTCHACISLREKNSELQGRGRNTTTKNYKQERRGGGTKSKLTTQKRSPSKQKFLPCPTDKLHRQQTRPSTWEEGKHPETRGRSARSKWSKHQV